MAYSYPCLPRYFSDNDRKNWIETYLKAPEIYAESLQAPVIVSNKTGCFSSPVPVGIVDFDAEFAGGTAIFDRNGNALVRMSENQAGVLVSEVLLGEQSGVVKQNRSKQKGWLLPYSRKTKVMMELNRKIGTAGYRYSKKRKRAVYRDNA
jgi:hypothetical protein